jgi:hypothetical protein
MLENVAELTDSYIDLYSVLGQQEAELAQEVVDNWTSTFEKISEIREKFLAGEDIGDSLTTSLEDFIKYAENYSGNLVEDYKNGKVNINSFTQPEFDTEGSGIEHQYGLDMFSSLGIFNYDKAAKAVGIEFKRTNTKEIRAAAAETVGNLFPEDYDWSKTSFKSKDNFLASFKQGSLASMDLLNEQYKIMFPWISQFADLQNSITKATEHQSARDTSIATASESAENSRAIADTARSALSGNRDTASIASVFQDAGVDQN